VTVNASNPSSVPVAGVAVAGVPVVADDAGTSPAALRQQGLQRLRAGGFAEAIELLGRASALDPHDPQTRLNLGIALQGGRRHAEALEHFGPAQKALPNDPAPFLHAAVSWLALGKAEAALAAASDACNRAPRLPQALYVHGQVLLALNQPQRAEQAFAAALERAPAWADAWVNCGVARYRQGAIEGAKAAMRQALHHAPGNAAANANLAALLRLGGETQANVSATPEARGHPGLNRQAASDNVILSAWQPKSRAVSLGLAVEFLIKKPVFANLKFGEWSHVLIGQITRGHYCFVVDQHRRIHGFLGWALTHQRLAEQWVEGRSGLRNEECREGDCFIINAWAADTNRGNRFILGTVRKLLAGKRTIYFKRYYPDGRTRPMRLAVNDFVAGHVARAAARHVNSTSDTGINKGQRPK
jgi:Flp pilus assembly protein TadD/hemolysin-activating ACP:hemolysin acyltransferase